MSLKLGSTTISGISRETKLDAHSLLDFKWTDHILNEMSWLRADTFSWQSGDVYTSVYNLLVSEYQNGTEETEGSITFKRSTNGYKITIDESAVSTLFNESGVAWYYILDTTNKRFKLPRTTHREVIESYVDGANGYRIWSDGYCEQWGVTGAMGDYATATITFVKTFANTNYIIQGNTIWQGTNDDTTWMQAWKIQQNSLETTGFSFYSRSNTKKVFRWKASGYLAEGQYNKDSLPNNKNLYFYVGEFSQTATEQTAGITTEMFNNKADTDLSNCTKPHIVETYVNGTSWYRVWSDGYCEQGGFDNVPAGGHSVNLLKTFKDTNYSVLANSKSAAYFATIGGQSTGSFTLYSFIGSQGYGSTVIWRAYGYLAEGQY